MSTDLRTAFNNACNLFNAGKYNELGQVMDTNIILKKVDDPGSVIGKGNVITYLNTQQAQKNPQFNGNNIPTNRVSANGLNGEISGTGDYQDTSTSNKTPVSFTFWFTRTNTNADWMLINAFAAPVS